MLHPLTEMYLWPIVSILLAIIFLRQGGLASFMLLFLSSAVLFYFAISASLGEEISITTMRWPRSPEDLLSSVRIMGLWVVTFSAVRVAVWKLFITRVYFLAISRFRPYSRQAASSKGSFLLSLLAGSILLVLSAEGWWVFVSYPESKSIWRVIDIGGSGFLSILLLLYSFQAGLGIGAGYRRASVFVAMFMCVHFILSGDRGSLLFWVIAIAAVLYLQGEKKQRRRLITLAALGLAPFLMLLNQISTWRSGGGVSEATGFASYVEEIDLLPQSFAHLVVSAEIVEFHGPYFESMLDFLLRFIVQIVPSVVLYVFDWKFYNGPWSFAEFARHGGGFLVPAEMFFIGGYWGVIVISSYFAVIAVILDRLLARVFTQGIVAFRELTVLSAALATASFPYTFFYGLQSINRMATLPIVLIFAVLLYRNIKLALQGRAYDRL
ncbi:hypothetical protein [Spiribacter roseus]|uniref:hypothetical protein n=1 Tax=Spiribacter roseus TaxID=1855875 RepID=UPI001F40445F|nr:hypothetical protein [Spiribacter roseus]